jgi:monovalent cation:H+ antiporter-2, CPA2 family
MNDAHDLLQTLAIVLCLAAVTTVVFQRLKQPVVFGYLLAGFIASPYTPIPLVADAATVRTLAELGVILLMFSLGLEFSIRKLIRVGPTAGVVAAAQSALMIWLGYTAGRLFGWTHMESVYAGAVIAISSTTIIAKAFTEQRVKGKFTELVLGILIIEDLIGIVLITILTTVSAGGALTATALGVTTVRLVSFLAVLIGVGLLLVPRIIRMVVAKSSEETTLVVSIGICFAAALAALAFEYSVALGAFIAGSLIAESGEEKTVEHLVRPVRDIFAAIFFVAVGMMLDPRVVVRYWPAVLVFTVMVITGKVLFVTVAAFFTGYSPRTAVQSGMSLAQIGEFSFIIAGVGLASGATREFLYPIAVSVSAITTLTTPWLIRSAVPTAAWVDAKLPHPIQTFASLYGSWIERLRSTPAEPKKRSRARRLTGLLLLDGVLLATVIIAAVVEMPRFTTILRAWTGAEDEIAELIVIGGAVAVGIPLVIGLLQGARRLGLELALRALPSAAEGKVDIAAAPRRALVVTLQMAIILAIAIPLLALTRPFTPGFSMEIAVIALVVIVGIGFWRSAMNLEGHARAGAEVIAGALSRQMSNYTSEPEQMVRTIEQMHSFLPGLGEPTPVRVEPGSAAAGKTLAELNLRGFTGATCLAILRPDEQVLAPHGREMLRSGDLLAVAGTSESIAAARAMIENGTVTQEHAIPVRGVEPERAELEKA